MLTPAMPWPGSTSLPTVSSRSDDPVLGAPGPPPGGHVPVLSQASITLLQPRPGGVYVDATVGAGGHARLILERIGPRGRLLGIDCDEAALEATRRALAPVGPTVVLRRGNFRDLAAIARDEGFDAVHGVLLDLGVSSLQLDDPERGFSFRREGPLDMRMDQRGSLTAEQVVNRMPERELARVIHALGQERWAARVARFIVERRPLRTTRDLAEAVAAAIPRRAWPRDLHPATRTFQAIRMYVNDELANLEAGLEGAVDLLAGGGRLVVISFHSLEDGTVKRFLEHEARGCVCPPGQPVCTCGHRPRVRALTRRPLRPSPEEIAANPRSRSARLRAAERL
ncbi:MAG TPA: 16S rRNA (cytosine(1402)-N(4))-methyltransferase RsmH [Candidatus Dormibacteraeota bacterium]|nr:16S rRNA (cytosine(1402)-N(4))-methyltransferase RsmH [Candidatus Dormibacteraeota bacterium]